MPNQQAVWRRNGEHAEGRIDRPQALDAIQRTLALGAAAVGGATWYQDGLMANGDPLVPATLSVAILMWVGPWLAQRLPLEFRVVLFHLVTLGFLAMYVLLRHVAGNPLHSAAYVALPVLSALVLSGMAASFITVILSAGWTVLVTVKGWVVTGADDLITTGAILIVAVVVATLLANERRRSVGWVRRWSSERTALDSLLSGSGDAIAMVDRNAQPVISNDQATNWFATIARCTPNTTRFWEGFDDALSGQWADAMAAASKGQKRVLLFQTGAREIKRWRATLIPHLRAEGVIITIQNVTDAFPSEQLFDLARIAQARQYLKPARQNTSKPTGPLKRNPGVLAEQAERVV